MSRASQLEGARITIAVRSRNGGDARDRVGGVTGGGYKDRFSHGNSIGPRRTFPVSRSYWTNTGRSCQLTAVTTVPLTEVDVSSAPSGIAHSCVTVADPVTG